MRKMLDYLTGKVSSLRPLRLCGDILKKVPK